MSNKVFKQMKSDRFAQAQRRKAFNLNLKHDYEGKKAIKSLLKQDDNQEQQLDKEVQEAIANLDRRKKEIKKRLINEGYEPDELTWINH